MSTALYDLGARMRAAQLGHPVPRLRHAAQLPPTHPVAVTVDAAGRGGPVVHAATPAATAQGRGRGALTALAGLGVTPAAETAPTLVVPDLGALTALTRLARTTAPGAPGAEAAAVIAWWDQRADHPGVPSVLLVVPTASARWALGTAPEADRDLDTWRAWLGIRATGPAALLAVALAVTAGETLPGLDEVAAADQRSWDYLRERVAAGWDWRRPDDRTEAALGLATRTDAAELYESLLLGDPLHALQESFTGTVVTGTVTEAGQRALVLDAARPLCRLRADTDVTGWVGDPETTSRADRLRGRVGGSSITPAGVLQLRIEGLRVHGTAPSVGAPVTLRPAPIDPAAQQHGRRALRARYRSGGNWLATGRTPAPRRRDVPLDVLVAAADE